MSCVDLDGNEILPTIPIVETKAKKTSPFDFVSAISYTKENLFETTEDAMKNYVPFIVNRALSFNNDTIVQANFMNRYKDLPKDMQFKFLSESIRKRKRYGKWEKYQEEDKIQLIKTFYKYGTAKAMQVASLITDDQLARMSHRMFIGGLKRAT